MAERRKKPVFGFLDGAEPTFECALPGLQLALAEMLPSGRGHIINVSSAAGRAALAYNGVYSATKAAIVLRRLARPTSTKDDDAFHADEHARPSCRCTKWTALLQAVAIPLGDPLLTHAGVFWGRLSER